jgi:hypothetical protein
MQDVKVIEADRRPSILARMLGSMLQKTREVVGLSYDNAAARLGCEADWLTRVETGFMAAAPEGVARMLVDYGVGEAKVADEIIDMARRVAAPLPGSLPDVRQTRRRATPHRGLPGSNHRPPAHVSQDRRHGVGSEEACSPVRTPFMALAAARARSSACCW